MDIIKVSNILGWYASLVSQTVRYECWSDEWCRKEIKRYNDSMLEELRPLIDWYHLSINEASVLGFHKWDGDLYLIPLYLLPILPIGIEVTCISGEKIIYDGKNIDDDQRFGCIAYGINITDKVDSEIKNETL